jgi:hypothetical protein
MSQVVDGYIELEGRNVSWRLGVANMSQEWEEKMGSKWAKVITGPENRNYSRTGGRESNKEP